MDGIISIPANGQYYIRHLTAEVIRQNNQTGAISDSGQAETSAANLPQQDFHEEIPAAMGQRLEYQFNKDLGQVIIKVIDLDTDTVIKELPPAEFQRMHLAIREAIGQLIDKKV